MKTLFKLTLLLLLVGCSTDDTENRQEPVNCNCATVISANTYTIPSRVWTVVVTKNDCTGLQKQREREGVVSVGAKICD